MNKKWSDFWGFVGILSVVILAIVMTLKIVGVF